MAGADRADGGDDVTLVVGGGVGIVGGVGTILGGAKIGLGAVDVDLAFEGGNGNWLGLGGGRTV